MFKIEGDKIHITRGDIALIEVKAKNDDGTDYTFKKDEVIRLNVFKSKDCGCIVLTKDIPIEKETTSVDISLTSEDTTIDELINKPKKYWYEIILNPDTNEQTIVGYDLDGEKEFWLYPEGKEPIKPKLTIEFQTDYIEGYDDILQTISGDFDTIKLESNSSYTAQVQLPMTKDITWDVYTMGGVFISLYVDDVLVAGGSSITDNVGYGAGATSPIIMLSNELIEKYNITVNSKVYFKLKSQAVV